MARNNRNNLSRHEELRYEYLLKNLEYLNTKEKHEFDYLYTKKMGNQIQENHYQASQNQDLTYDNEQAGYYEEETDYAEDDSYTTQGLPVYPEESNFPKRSSRQEVTEYVEYLPQIYQEPEDYYMVDEAYQDQDLAPYQEAEEVKAKPKKKVKKARKKGGCFKRFIKILGIAILLVLGGMIYMFFKGVNDVSSGKTNYSPAVTEVFNGQDAEDGTNILILGSDQRITQGSSDARTDTIMVMNIGNSDGKVKLVSFMRDTLVNIEGVSYNDYTFDQKLNVAFNIGEQNNNQGAELMRQTLKNNFDIDIKYYVMIDFETFGEAVDTLFPKGVEIDAEFSTVDGEEVSSVEAPNDIGFGDQSTPYQTIYVGNQRMNGQTLLNYARFRSDDSGDFGRTTRQQQVVEAIVNQVKDPTKLFTGSAALGKIYALTSTNVSFPYILTNGLSTLSDASKGIEYITIPAEGDWVDEYDMYGGLGLFIDFDKYRGELADLGLR